MGKKTDTAAKRKTDSQSVKQKKPASKAQKVTKAPTKPKPTHFNVQTHPFVKKLADNDKIVRENTLKSLSLFLQTKREIPTLEILKLWRALFFSMWLSDRPLTQQKLADELADLLSQVEPINYSSFLDAFWIIIAREWEGLDRYRLDKFYLLVRRYVAASFRKLKQEQWDEDWVDDFITILKHIPLNLDDLKIPNGIRFHMFDIFLDEFERVMKEDDISFTKGVGLAIAPNTKDAKLPEFHTADSDGEEESDSDASDSDDDSDEEEDEGYIPETEEEKAAKEQEKKAAEDSEEEARAKEWILLAKKIKENNVPLKKLLKPIEDIAKKSKYSHVKKGAQEVLEDPRLIVWGIVEAPEEEEEEEEVFAGFD